MTAQASSIHELSANSLEGQSVALSTFKDKVLLVVNTASQCGFTSQYQGLQAVYSKYKDQGFAVLGFPCNQFGQQEPGTSSQIQSFCETRYGVTFPLFEKVEVKGGNAHPVFQFLTESAPGAIEWNFTKFLVDRSGKVVKRYASATSPEQIEKDIQALI